MPLTQLDIRFGFKSGALSAETDRLRRVLDRCKVFGDTAAGIENNHALSLQGSRWN
jgi:hypothetical protein